MSCGGFVAGVSSEVGVCSGAIVGSGVGLPAGSDDNEEEDEPLGLLDEEDEDEEPGAGGSEVSRSGGKIGVESGAGGTGGFSAVGLDFAASGAADFFLSASLPS